MSQTAPRVSRWYVMMGFSTPCCRAPVVVQVMTDGTIQEAFCGGCLQNARPIGLHFHSLIVADRWEWSDRTRPGEAGSESINDWIERAAKEYRAHLDHLQDKESDHLSASMVPAPFFANVQSLFDRPPMQVALRETMRRAYDLLRRATGRTVHDYFQPFNPAFCVVCGIRRADTDRTVWDACASCTIRLGMMRRWKRAVVRLMIGR